MSRLLEDLQKILSESEISLEDQNDLLVFLPIFPKESLEKLIKVFQRDADTIKEFNQNFKSKLKALVSKDNDEWDEMVKQQEEEVKSEEETLEMKPENEEESFEN